MVQPRLINNGQIYFIWTRINQEVVLSINTRHALHHIVDKFSLSAFTNSILSARNPSLDHHDESSSSYMLPYLQQWPTKSTGGLLILHSRLTKSEYSKIAAEEIKQTSSFHLTLYLRFLSSLSSLLLSSSCSHDPSINNFWLMKKIQHRKWSIKFFFLVPFHENCPEEAFYNEQSESKYIKRSGFIRYQIPSWVIQPTSFHLKPDHQEYQIPRLQGSFPQLVPPPLKIGKILVMDMAQLSPQQWATQL